MGRDPWLELSFDAWLLGVEALGGRSRQPGAPVVERAAEARPSAIVVSLAAYRRRRSSAAHRPA